MLNKLPKSFHISKRKELLKNTEAGLIVLASNGQIQMSLDQSYDFVQESNFYYLTGLNIADLILVINKAESFLILPEINHYMEVFDGELDLKEIKNISGITKLYNHEEGLEKLKEVVKDNKKLHTLFDENDKLKTYGITALPFRSNLINLIKSFNKKIKLVGIEVDLARMRMIKSDEEIKLISKASKIIKDSINELDLLKLKNTKEVALEIERLMIKKGASAWAFKPVISTSKASTVIHYVDLDQDLKKGNLLLVDVGCKFEGYNSDISRTMYIGKPSKRQTEVIEAVKNVQEDLIKYLKPGISFRELENKCEELIGLKLIELGLIKKANNNNIRKYYPHAVTHHLGIDTHDLADYSEVLSENMVITIEPGIYIEKEEIGVRFEDDILITKTSARVL